MSENQDRTTDSSPAPNKAEVSLLLDLVEKIQQDIDQNTRQIIIILTAITSVYWSIIIIFRLPNALFHAISDLIPGLLPLSAYINIAVALLFAEVFSALAYVLFGLESLRLRLFTDEKLASDTLEVIREITRLEGWSTLEKALIRVRISRLEIIPSQPSRFRPLTMTTLLSLYIKTVMGMFFKLRQ
jgi:hypothetical protein